MSVYKFRVLIDSDKEADVFRDILIDENENMETFFNFIMSSFQFKGNQMASFYKSDENWSKGLEISLIDMEMDDDNTDPVVIMSEHKINEFVEEDDQRFILVYDFIKMWIFLIELVDEKDGKLASPKLDLSAGKSPDEDDKIMDEDRLFDFDSANGDDFNPSEEDEDEFGFNDFDDYGEDYNPEDY